MHITLTNSKQNREIIEEEDVHLKVSFTNSISYSFSLAEKIDLYLKDKRIIKNIIIVFGKFIYYYENRRARDYFRDGVPPPSVNVQERFEFSDNDIVYIVKGGSQPTTDEHAEYVEFTDYDDDYVEISTWKKKPSKDKIIHSFVD